MRKWLPWVLLAVVAAAALTVAGMRSSGAPSPAQRAASIASEVRCPVCEGQSAEVSDAPAAGAVRAFILQEVKAGRSKGVIEQELEDRYGTDILLRPPASGVAGLVWVLPVAAIVVAAGALALAFRRWHALTAASATAEDRARVEEERTLRGGA